MKKDKKTWIIVLLIILVLAVALVLLWAKPDFVEKASTKQDEIHGAEEKESVQEITEGPVIETAKVKESNAYDYILEVMSSPQYWDEKTYFPAYYTPWEEEEARKTLVNATGWTLIDEEKAIFKRGYEGTLTLNFSDHIAISKDEKSGLTYTLDYKNGIYEMSLNGEVVNLTINRGEGYFNTSFGKIEDTFNNYEKLFSASGCPLLGKPAGTLKSYKKLNVHRAQVKEDNLIHNVWDQEDFSFDFTNAKGLCYLNSYKEILSAKTPDIGLVPIMYGDGKGNYTEYQTAYNTPVYLVLSDSHEGKPYEQYDNINEAFAAYFLKPMYEAMYGYNAVYFVNGRDVSGPSDLLNLDTKEDILAGFSWDYDGQTQPILEIQNKGEKIDAICYLSSGYSNLEMLFETTLYRAKEYFPNAKIPFASDYIGNFKLIYDKETQITLGLR